MKYVVSLIGDHRERVYLERVSNVLTDNGFVTFNDENDGVIASFNEKHVIYYVCEGAASENNEVNYRFDEKILADGAGNKKLFDDLREQINKM